MKWLLFKDALFSAPLSKSTDWQPEFSGDKGTRIWFPDLIKEGEWHHLVVVLNRQVLKNATFSLFVNGQHIATQKYSNFNSELDEETESD